MLLWTQVEVLKVDVGVWVAVFVEVGLLVLRQLQALEILLGVRQLWRRISRRGTEFTVDPHVAMLPGTCLVLDGVRCFDTMLRMFRAWILTKSTSTDYRTTTMMCVDTERELCSSCHGCRGCLMMPPQG